MIHPTELWFESGTLFLVIDESLFEDARRLLHVAKEIHININMPENGLYKMLVTDEDNEDMAHVFLRENVIGFKTLLEGGNKVNLIKILVRNHDGALTYPAYVPDYSFPVQEFQIRS